MGKIEREHASAITKILKSQMPDVKEAEEVFDNEAMNFKASNQREKTATALYLQFAKEASEQRLKFFFEAIALVERDPINITANQ